MRKIVLGMHISLDGFVAGLHGEMDWIQVSNEMFEVAGRLTNEADTALYGRVTWQMMDAYWPTAAEGPDASKHDIEHSEWYNRVMKVVASRTVQQHSGNTMFIGNNLTEKVNELKKQPGKNIQIFGSPSVVHTLMQQDLIDDYWLFVNPVVLGQGIPLFKGIGQKTELKLISSETFPAGVVCLHYEAKR
jgi:dihydrofolate reductase